MYNARIIFKKQVKDTGKNMAVLIQFVLFPVITLLMEGIINIEGMPAHFYASMFSAMYVGMAPLTAASSVISEEKEKNTLRVLMMSKVKPLEYLFGVIFYVWLLTMAGCVVIGIGTGYSSKELGVYLLFMAIGAVISAVFGAAIGVTARNQLSATSVMMPFMLIFAFGPMFSMFNDNIAKVTQFLYTQQISDVSKQLTDLEFGVKNALILIGNFAVGVGYFVAIFRKKGLES